MVRMDTYTMADARMAVVAVLLNITAAISKADVSFFLSVIVSLLAIVYYVIKIVESKRKKDVGKGK